MLNEERVILMTKLASYENGEGRKNVAIGNYFRSDYIGIQMAKSVISATIAFAVVFIMYILYDLETFMLNLYKIDLFVFARNVLIIYCIVVISYAVITFFVCTYRYNKARKSLKNYYANLKKLASLYEKNNYS
ncbi:MAG: hypothetical protein ACI4SA_06695 [Lachnospiraceae bacterium]